MIKKHKARTAQKIRIWTTIKQSASVLLFGELHSPEAALQIFSQTHLCDLIGSYLCCCDQERLARVFPTFRSRQRRPCMDPKSCCEHSKDSPWSRIKCPYCLELHLICPQMYSVDLTTNKLIPVDVKPLEAMKRVNCYPRMRQMYSNRLSNGNFNIKTSPFDKYFIQSPYWKIEYRQVDLCEAQQFQALHFLIGPLQAWLCLAESKLN